MSTEKNRPSENASRSRNKTSRSRTSEVTRNQSSASSRQTVASSESIDSGWQEMSDYIKLTPIKYYNRTKLVNSTLKELGVCVVYFDLHATVVRQRSTKQCRPKITPFDLMFRYIASAPGIVNIGEYSIPKNIDTNMTPDQLANYLTNTGHDEDTSLNVFRHDDGSLNLGRDVRHHKIINYRSSPYCMKIFNKDKEFKHWSIYVLPQNEPRCDLLADKQFFIWLKKNKKLKGTTFHYENGKERIYSVSNEAVFLYLFQQKEIKRVFVVDYSCDVVIGDQYPETFSADSEMEELLEQGRDLAQIQQTLKEKKNKTITEQTRLKDVEKTIDGFEKHLYEKTKARNPLVRNIKKFQSRAKVNKNRWHIIKKGDLYYR